MKRIVPFCAALPVSATVYFQPRMLLVGHCLQER